MPHAGEDDIGVTGLQLNIGSTQLIGEEKHLLPGLATIV
jgi:hypothetical protein